MTFSTMNSRELATFLAHRAGENGRCQLCGEKLRGVPLACDINRYAYDRLGLGSTTPVMNNN